MQDEMIDYWPTAPARPCGVRKTCPWDIWADLFACETVLVLDEWAAALRNAPGPEPLPHLLLPSTNAIRERGLPASGRYDSFNNALFDCHAQLHHLVSIDATPNG